MSKSPTARTLEALRDDGWIADVVERWYGGKRHDFCGFADLIAFRGDTTLAVQATSYSNTSARVKKIEAEPMAKVWADSDTRRIEVWGWKKHKQPIDRKLWRPRIVRVR